MARMIRLVGLALFVCALALLVAACDGGGQGGAPKGKAQTTCPVKGEKINKEIFTDHEGKRVYFCCPECVEQFKKEPQKYIKKLEDEGVVLDGTPRKSC